MLLLYNFGISLYSLLVRIVSLRSKKAKQWVNGRANFFERFQREIEGNENIIWVHCASLGEFEQGRPLIETIKATHPQYKILLTFFSPSGYEVRKNYDKADFVFYLPLDTFKNAKRFVEIANPKMVFFIKYEFWYYFLLTLKNKNIPVYIVSSIFRKNQLFFKTYGGWYRNILKSCSHIFVQNNESLSLLKSIGINNCTITGDTRFDRVAEVTMNPEKIAVVEHFLGTEQKAIVCGSTWKPDEDFLLTIIEQFPNEKFIIAPHEVTPESITRLQSLLNGKSILYSEAKTLNELNGNVLIIDCYGILTSVYQYGKIAYIGGGFGVGIHNILEAAAFGMPVIFGPNYTKFNEAVELIRQGGAFTYSTQEELTSLFISLLESSIRLNESSNVSEKFVKGNIGATQIILNKIFGK